MQEKVQLFSPVKRRILKYVEFLDISKREFYAATGISRGTLENSTGITEDTLAKLFAVYRDINTDWLITGTGDMLKRTKENSPAAPPSYSAAPSVSIVEEPTINYGSNSSNTSTERIEATDSKKLDIVEKPVELLINRLEELVAENTTYKMKVAELEGKMRRLGLPDEKM